MKRLGFALFSVLPMCTNLMENLNVHCSRLYFCCSRRMEPNLNFVAMWMRLKEWNLASCHVSEYDKLMLTSVEQNNMSEPVTIVDHEPWGLVWKHKQTPRWARDSSKPMLCAIKNVENAYKIMCGGIEWGACNTNRCSDSFLAVGRCSGFILKHWIMKSCASVLKCWGIGGSSPFMTLKKNANYTHKQTKQSSLS